MSRFGARRGCPDYDSFRTGLRYYDVYQLAKGRRYRRRGTVLGLWHQLKLELYYAATGVALVVALVAGCGSVTAADALRFDSGDAFPDLSAQGPETPDVGASSPDAVDGQDRDASPTLPACQWDAHAPHEVVKCEAGPDWSCHYLDSGGRPDGFLTGCQDGGRECAYPCQ